MSTIFNPAYGLGQTGTTGASSATLSGFANNKAVMVVNTGATNSIYVRTGPTGAAASSADVVVMPGESVILWKEQDHDLLAYINGAGSSTFHAIPGEVIY